MDISLDRNQGQYHIQSYQQGELLINNETYQEPIVLGLDFLQQAILPSKMIDINKKLLCDLKIQDYEAVILGTGQSLIFPEWDLLEQAQLLGKPLEVMATDAACRTFAVLASEGRQVLALLYP